VLMKSRLSTWNKVLNFLKVNEKIHVDNKRNANLMSI
jgi:hypothetical protein